MSYIMKNLENDLIFCKKYLKIINSINLDIIKIRDFHPNSLDLLFFLIIPYTTFKSDFTTETCGA